MADRSPSASPPGAHLDPVLASARRAPGVVAVRVDGDDLLVDFSGDDAAAANLLSALVADGYPVTHFGERPTSLEEMFLTLTGEYATDDGAASEAGRVEEVA